MVIMSTEPLKALVNKVKLLLQLQYSELVDLAEIREIKLMRPVGLYSSDL